MNPYSGIISQQFKNLFTNAIQSLLYDDSLTISCKLFYGITKYETCNNCGWDVIGRKSNNTYIAGGPAPFQAGSICPMCNGQYKRPVETSEDIKLAVVFDFKKFMGKIPVNVNQGDLIQILANQEIAHKLKMAREIEVATNFGLKQRFVINGEIQPAGLGDNNFFFSNWKRSG